MKDFRDTNVSEPHLIITSKHAVVHPLEAQFFWLESLIVKTWIFFFFFRCGLLSREVKKKIQ